MNSMANIYTPVDTRYYQLPCVWVQLSVQGVDGWAVWARLFAAHDGWSWLDVVLRSGRRTVAVFVRVCLL